MYHFIGHFVSCSSVYLNIVRFKYFNRYFQVVYCVTINLSTFQKSKSKFQLLNSYEVFSSFKIINMYFFFTQEVNYSA